MIVKNIDLLKDGTNQITISANDKMLCVINIFKVGNDQEDYAIMVTDHAKNKNNHILKFTNSPDKNTQKIYGGKQ